MKIKKFNSLFCKHEPEESTWKCELDDIRREFDNINLRSVELFPFEGDAALQTTVWPVYCSMIEGKETPILFCDTDRRRLERRLSGIKSYGIKEIGIK